MALHSLYCADMPLRNCSLTYSLIPQKGLHQTQCGKRPLWSFGGHWNENSCDEEIACDWVDVLVAVAQGFAQRLPVALLNGFIFSFSVPLFKLKHCFHASHLRI